METTFGYRNSDSMDLGYGHAIGDEDLEGREKPKVAYICGGNINLIIWIGCGKENKFDRDSVIRCMHCSHRIFYKKREKKILQYLAR
jgi:DNA-directed RNA polymerase subunit RPC12/RpoP